jgi:hypothetical protein
MTVKESISAQSAAGVAPRKVMATLQCCDPDTLISPKDIANAKHAQRRDELVTLTSTEVLFKKLAENDFYFKFEVDTQSRLRYLFWAHSEATKWFAMHSDVLIFDCTYKTNQFDLPLLNVIAMTGFNTVLPVAQCWLPGETEQDFVWALHQLMKLMETASVPPPSVLITDRDLACMNAIGRVFPAVPSMVCR